MLFVVLCPGTPKGSTGSGSGLKASQKTGNGLKSHLTDREKPGIEPATPGLQDIGLSPTIFVTLPTPRADMNQSQGRLRPSLLL